MPRRSTKRKQNTTGADEIEKEKVETITKKTKSIKISSDQKISELFDKYKDAENQKQIGPDGIERFCQDLGVSPEDVAILVLAFYLQPQEMGIFTKEEFTKGLLKMGAHTIEEITAALPSLRNELNDPVKFKEIYRFSFLFTKGTQKSLEIQLAQNLLAMVMKGKPHVDSFVTFLGEQKSYRVLNIDQWMLFPDFSTQIDVQLKNYSLDAAWPVLYDEYVEWLKQQKKITKMDIQF
eukprot:TRINITY_DN4436_c0_g1_i1.p1 TRINITY_DN4436_c0_g1~~TRINITY_DN4436_c0_g1_i1.p1  ORF type:complete len:246 (-),score=70.80 TRINITY_DN4436_c0_g1_i1:80-787(-)